MASNVRKKRADARPESRSSLPARGGAWRRARLAANSGRRRNVAAVHSTLARAADGVRSPSEMSDVYAEIHALVREPLRARSLLVVLRDQVSGALSFPYYAGEVRLGPAARALADALTEQVLRSGEPLLTNARSEPSPPGTPGPGPRRDWLGVPLKLGSQVLGALVVRARAQSPDYGERELEVLSFAARHIVAAMEQRRADEESKRTVSVLRSTLDSTADGILVVDHGGRVVSFNHRFAALWRIPREMLAMGDDAALLAHVLNQLRQPEQFLDKVRELYARPEAEAFDVLEFKDGRVFERYSIPLRQDAAAVGRVWSFRDVTKARNLELRLLESQKLEAIGRLAGGVAHDFNNLLTVIRSRGELARVGLSPGEPLHAHIAEILEAAERATALTQQLLAFSRRQVLRPRVLDLNRIVLGIDQLLRRVIGEDIEWTTRLAPDLGFVSADPVQIEQVILNLAVNARDAMPDGGCITLETANVELDEAYCQTQPGARPGPHVRLLLGDTGHGMDAATCSRVFEPFFTTKVDGRGTGLGLATVYGIVQQSNGHIGVESAVGKGTTFSVFLPRVEGPAEPARPAPARGEVRKGSETVLLVEDHDAVRRLAREVLEAGGYLVLEASCGRDALAAAAAHTGPIHLLVSDVVMPEMAGPELARRLTEVRPELRVLFVSGYTEKAVADHGIGEQEAAFLPKPFWPDALIRKVRAVLDGAG